MSILQNVYSKNSFHLHDDKHSQTQYAKVQMKDLNTHGNGREKKHKQPGDGSVTDFEGNRMGEQIQQQ